MNRINCKLVIKLTSLAVIVLTRVFLPTYIPTYVLLLLFHWGESIFVAKIRIGGRYLYETRKEAVTLCFSVAGLGSLSGQVILRLAAPAIQQGHMYPAWAWQNICKMTRLRSPLCLACPASGCRRAQVQHPRQAPLTITMTR